MHASMKCLTLLIMAGFILGTGWAADQTAKDGKTTVAAYYFGNYHVDPRNEKRHGKGWTEWDLIKLAQPRFAGHVQPKVPAWGYEDESDPAVMRKKIEAAASHGIDAFIFDWYWYDDGPFLDRPLDKGFLPSAKDGRLKFALMWANHDWTDIQPAKAHNTHELQFPGKFTPATWEKATDYIAKTYFTHPAYWTIDGRAYFSIYEVDKLVASFGSIEATRQALERFDAKAKAVGLKGLHFNIVFWGRPILPGETAPANPEKLVAALGAASVSSYVWVHHVGMQKFPVTPYTEVMTKAIAHWKESEKKYGVPYYPNVTMGWDPSPRTVQSDRYENLGYPFTPIMGDNTPENYKAALIAARDYLAQRPANERILSLNAWNEWTEGSYLEPDTVNGMKYLDAIKEVFGK